MNRAPLAAYLRWNLRDGLPRLAVPIGLFLLLGGLPIWSLARTSGIASLREPSAAQQLALQAYTGMLEMSMTLGALVLMSGVVAFDRERQYFRFLFSNPVAPWQFYLQRYLLSVIAFALVMMVIPLGFSMIVTEVPVLAVAKSALLYGALYGALAMLAGALLNRDGIVLIGVVVITTMLQHIKAELPGWLGTVADALPPIAAADAVSKAWLNSSAADLGSLGLVVAYSLGMLAVALLLIRRAPLAR